MKYGSIPAGGLGVRANLPFSKELAPVARRPVIEYLISRMLSAGIDKIFINTAEDKTDLIRYLSTKSPYRDHLAFLVRPRRGLLDGVVLPAQFLKPDDELYFGLPDTIWYPKDAFVQLDSVGSDLVLGLFDTGTPEKFDSVVIDDSSRIQSIDVKVPSPKTKWTWGIGKLTVQVANKLRQIETDHQLGRGEFGKAMHLYCQKNIGYAIELVDSRCIDVGVPDEYDRADAFVKKYEK